MFVNLGHKRVGCLAVLLLRETVLSTSSSLLLEDELGHYHDNDEVP